MQETGSRMVVSVFPQFLRSEAPIVDTSSDDPCILQ